MKPLQKLPEHDVLTEAWYNGSPNQVSVFQRKLLDSKFVSETSVMGEPVIILADNYIDSNFERTFMFLSDRCPTWPEMVALKDFLWNPGDVVFQVHPRKEDYVNINKHALHLWRPKDAPSLRTLQSVRLLIQQRMSMLISEPTSSTLIFKEGRCGAKDFVAIFGGTNWPTWEEVCAIKKHCFGEDRTALQFNISRELDLNSKHILILWDADDFNIQLPPKEYV